ncbi:MAG: hypothetical protein V4671_09485 [Armatimonadota bacterium]
MPEFVVTYHLLQTGGAEKTAAMFSGGSTPKQFKVTIEAEDMAAATAAVGEYLTSSPGYVTLETTSNRATVIPKSSIQSAQIALKQETPTRTPAEAAHEARSNAATLNAMKTRSFSKRRR